MNFAHACLSVFKSTLANYFEQIYRVTVLYPAGGGGSSGAKGTHPRSTDSTAHAQVVAGGETHGHTVARLDTGSSCHDFVSKAVADGLIARGAKVIPITGRVCSAFKAEGRKLSFQVICNYTFITISIAKKKA